jgi:hypothetical protein
MEGEEEAAVSVSFPVAQMVKSVINGDFNGFVWGDGGVLRPYRHVDVFIIGPRSYLEYNGVMEVAGSKKAIYGRTSIPRQSKFMEQFQQIGDWPDDVPE